MRDLIHTLSCRLCLPPSLITKDTQSLPIDYQGFDSIAFIVVLGQSPEQPSSARKIDIICQSSDDKNTWTPAPANELVGIKSDNNGVVFSYDSADKANTIIGWSYCGQAPYIRTNLALSGAWEKGLSATIIALLGQPCRLPFKTGAGKKVS